MHTITVADVLNNTLPETGWEEYHLYVFRDGNFVLYVGKSEQNIIDRLEDHLGLTYREESQVGKLVDDNAPDSFDWAIDLRTTAECTAIVNAHFPTCKMVDVNIAERSLILEFSPPLNGQSNPHPLKLPKKYTRRRDQRLLQAYRKVFGARS